MVNRHHHANSLINYEYMNNCFLLSCRYPHDRLFPLASAKIESFFYHYLSQVPLTATFQSTLKINSNCLKQRESTYKPIDMKLLVLTPADHTEISATKCKKDKKYRFFFDKGLETRCIFKPENSLTQPPLNSFPTMDQNNKHNVILAHFWSVLLRSFLCERTYH